MDKKKQGLAWLAQKIKEDKVQNPLTETDIAVIRGMANHNLRMSETAAALYMHRNTVEYHCKRIKQKTGADPRDFFGCCNLLVFVRDLEGKGKRGKT